jgi:hypothetical protein
MIFSFARLPNSIMSQRWKPSKDGRTRNFHNANTRGIVNGRERQCGTAIPESELALATKVRVPKRTTNKSFQMNDQPPDSD